MSEYTAELIWSRGDQDFLDKRFSRSYLIRFDGGTEVAGSASPHVVPAPLSDPAGVDPEEAFVASLAGCHMLWFLAIAAKRGFRVDRYRDSAGGVLGKDEQGRTAMTRVTLRPDVRFSGGEIPSREDIERIHHEAHAQCFIANSVKTGISVEPVYDGNANEN